MTKIIHPDLDESHDELSSNVQLLYSHDIYPNCKQALDHRQFPSFPHGTHGEKVDLPGQL